ncbi:MAG: hopanoid biosynthesis protein HpnM, partial [Sphingobium sp.]|nr:hopanoid biosynthesis protein HpnM [Sphingobium sp.]
MNRLPFSAHPRAAAAALVLVATAAPAQVADPARVPVEALDNGLIAIMKGGKKLGVTGRAAQ